MTNQVETPSNTESNEIISFDVVLREIGEFGRYQIINGILTCLVIAISTCALFNFVFSAAIPDHRCFVPECELKLNTTYQTDWLKLAVPFENGKPDACYRFDQIGKDSDTCSEISFNRSKEISCDEFVPKTDEERLANWLSINHCSSDKKKLTFIGTANTAGRFIIMPIVGIVSDKFGRLTTIVGSSILGAALGVIQAFSNSFEMYTILEFLVAIANAGIISTGFIYNAEWVSSKHRVALASINGVGNSIGCVAIGIAAMFYQNDFRAFKLWMSIPSLSVILLYFVLRESPRWLLARQKYVQAVQSIRYAAKVNGKCLTDKTAQTIESKSIRGINSAKNCVENCDQTTLGSVLRRKRLALRFFVLSLVWFFSLFSYYGVILGSTGLHENKYMSFIIVAVAELPGVVLALFIMDRLGRRTSVGGTLLICGIAIVTSSFLTRDQWIWQMVLFVIGKAALTTTFLSLYTYTSELWPTTVRNTIMNICSMLGRVGSITASFNVLLIDEFPYLPSFLCGLSATLAAILVFTFLPETLNKKLPDTVDDAIEIGNKK